MRFPTCLLFNRKYPKLEIFISETVEFEFRTAISYFINLIIWSELLTFSSIDQWCLKRALAQTAFDQRGPSSTKFYYGSPALFYAGARWVTCQNLDIFRNSLRLNVFRSRGIYGWEWRSQKVSWIRLLLHEVVTGGLVYDRNVVRMRL